MKGGDGGEKERRLRPHFAVMKQYVKANLTHEAAASVKYFVRLFAQSAEAVVFLFLGLSAMGAHQTWDVAFIIVTLVLCIVVRTLCVVVQCFALNVFRTRKFSIEEQFVMSYSGLRGPLAFGLLR